MPYFLSQQNLSLGKISEMVGDEAKHLLRSMRVKKGQKIKVQGPDKRRYITEISEIERNKLKFIALEEIGVPAEPKKEVVLFQAVLAEQALDVILQKSTELGAARIVLFNSERVAAKLSGDRWQAKFLRWSKILVEAAKQSERVCAPSLEFAGEWEQALALISKFNQIILLDPNGQSVKDLRITQSSQACAIIIGPEGGFTEQENNQIKNLPKAFALSLGPVLLRSDTAAIASLSIVQNLF